MGDPLTIGEHVRQLRRERGLSQRELGARAGVSHGYVALVEKGQLQSPGTFKLDALARALGLRTADALFGPRSPQPEPQAGPLMASPLARLRPVELPVFRWGSCGDPRQRESAPDPDHLDYAPLGKELLIGPRGFGVLVKGESMANRHIHDGDVVWVNPDRPTRVGGVVLAQLLDASGEDAGMVVKVLKRDEIGERLWGDGEGPDGTNPVLGSGYQVVGPVVLVSPAPHPPG